MSVIRGSSISAKDMLSDRNLVPDKQVLLLASILNFPPGEDYADPASRRAYSERVRPLLKKLDYPLKRPGKFEGSIFQSKTAKAVEMCDMHKDLNPIFIHQLFKFVYLEAGPRIHELRSAYREQLGREKEWDSVLWPLTYMHHLWLSPEKHRLAFGAVTDQWHCETMERPILPSPEQQPDGCEACVLTRVGSCYQLVLALRAAAKSRQTATQLARHPRRLRILRYLDAWLEFWRTRVVPKQIDDEKWSQRLLENDRLAEEVYDMRLEVKLARHEIERTMRGELNKRLHIVHKLESVSEVNVEKVVQDFENDIIDTYAALRSPQVDPLPTDYVSVRSRLMSVSRISPYRQDSSRTPTYHHTQAPGVPYDHSPNYHEPNVRSPPHDMESRYSANTVRNNDRVVGQSFAPTSTERSTAGKYTPGMLPHLEIDEALTSYGSHKRHSPEISPLSEADYAVMDTPVSLHELNDRFQSFRVSYDRVRGQDGCRKSKAGKIVHKDASESSARLSQPFDLAGRAYA